MICHSLCLKLNWSRRHNKGNFGELKQILKLIYGEEYKDKYSIYGKIQLYVLISVTVRKLQIVPIPQMQKYMQ